jgi:lipopolysaccharide transport system permease protein
MAMHRLDFLVELARRRVLERYIGSTSVLLWSLASPLMPLIANLLVFYFVARIPHVQSMGLVGYAAFAFSGVIAFRVVQRAVTEGCDLLVSNMDMLRSANFPLAYLSLAAVGSSLFDVVIQVVFVAVLLAATGQGITPSLAALPVALSLLLMFAVGISWLASIAGYLARETQEVATVVLTILLYLSPALYPMDAAPGVLLTFIEANPMTHFVIMLRDCLMPALSSPHWKSWAYAAALAFGAFAAGFALITTTKRYVGDLS